MSENNAKKVKGLFDIDMEAVNVAFKSYDSKKVEKIQIFILSSTLPNPYLLVMFGVLKLFLEKIRNQSPAFKGEIALNFLLIHEIGKYEEMKIYFDLIKEHYEFFIVHEEPGGVKKDLSSIIEMRFNEFKTLANKIMLNLVDENGEKMLAKDTILNFRYDDIYALSDKSGKYKEVDNLMDAYNDKKLENPKSELIRAIFFKKVNEKEELAKCLLRIFCHEYEQLSSLNGKSAIFFIADRWLKELFEEYTTQQLSSSTIFKEVNRRLICPSEDIEIEKLDLYLNPISKYYVREHVIDVKYFSSLLQKLSCKIFTPFENLAYTQYIDQLDPQRRDIYKDQIKEFEKNFQKPLTEIIIKGFLAVQEEDILAQLIYIA